MNLIQKAKQLRSNPTEAEYELWQHLRSKQVAGVRFRRQVMIDHYIVDFVSFELKLIIEVDGSQHMDNLVYDTKRTLLLNKLGYSVMRFWNNEVLADCEAVLEMIYLKIRDLKKEVADCEPPPKSSPLQGEDF